MIVADDGGRSIVGKSDLMLITGSAGFIGTKVTEMLLKQGFRNVRCLVRPSSNTRNLVKVASAYEGSCLEIMEGNLLSQETCDRAVADVSVIFHLAAGVDKSFPGAFMNSVVTTRNLIESAMREGKLKRFLNVSSFAVYSSNCVKRGAVLDEEAPIEDNPIVRGEAYTYAKVRQDELVLRYARDRRLPFTIVRPGAVFGPGRVNISGRVGIDTFGIYLHLGGRNQLPLTYVDNCAEAIVLAGVKRVAEGQIFNVVDDDLPTSRQFLRLYKKNVRHFKSIYVPYHLSYFLSLLWEKYSLWSNGQLPPVFNRSRARLEWRGSAFSNKKLRDLLGWRPRVSMGEALDCYFRYQRKAGRSTNNA